MIMPPEAKASGANFRLAERSGTFTILAWLPSCWSSDGSSIKVPLSSSVINSSS
jgi:hypothetical protein